MKAESSLLACILLLGWGPCAAQDFELRPSGTGDRIILRLPDGWREVFVDNLPVADQMVSVHKFLPPGETAKFWNRKITVSIISGPSLRMVPIPADGIARSNAIQFYEDYCSIKPLSLPIRTSELNHYPSAAYRGWCTVRPEVKAKPKFGKYLRTFKWVDGLVIQAPTATFEIEATWHSDRITIDNHGRFNSLDRSTWMPDDASPDRTFLTFANVFPCNPALPDKACKLP